MPKKLHFIPPARKPIYKFSSVLNKHVLGEPVNHDDDDKAAKLKFIR